MVPIYLVPISRLPTELSLPCKPIRVDPICFVRVLKTIIIHHHLDLAMFYSTSWRNRNRINRNHLENLGLRISLFCALVTKETSKETYKNRNSLACLRNACSYSAMTYCTLFCPVPQSESNQFVLSQSCFSEQQKFIILVFGGFRFFALRLFNTACYGLSFQHFC
jgi:hypothetical protein